MGGLLVVFGCWALARELAPDDNPGAFIGMAFAFASFLLLDDASDQVDGKYMALPERLFTIDAGGIITWRSDIGPWGFDVEAWSAAIEALTASPEATAQA